MSELFSGYNQFGEEGGPCQCEGCTLDRMEVVVEHQILVVFDVEADTREDAATIVRDVLRMHDGSHLRAAINEAHAEAKDGQIIDAWWFPEREDKRLDGNDRPSAHLQWDKD